MKRRNFISKNIVAGTLIPAAFASMGFSNQKVNLGLSDQKIDKLESSPDSEDNVVIERLSEGRPHSGKVLAVIQPHCDDIAYYAAGTVAKLIYEGYTGYLIRTSNDDAAGGGATMGERGWKK